MNSAITTVLLGLWCLIITSPIAGEATLSERPPREKPPLVVKIHMEDQAITPVTAQFIGRSIDQAEATGAECLVIVLDTPGGLVDSTRKVVKAILASEVPVVVYVAPSGAQAASAGVFITLSGHVAAMSPGTSIGAAHPVQIGGLPISPGSQPGPREADQEGADTPAESPLEQKIVNNTVAWARSLAALRGRNVEWAAQAVKESVSVSETEAVEQKVVDLIATNMDDLLAQLDGRDVKLAKKTIQLRTANAQVLEVEMWWGEKLLAVLSSPNVAFLLLILGFYGIVFEFYSPGWGVAGTLGIVCLLVAFFALAILPVNYVGLILIAVALAMFVAEALVTSFGALTAGGVICMVLGGLMLVDSPVGFLRVSLGVVGPVAAATALITIFLVGSIVRAHRMTAQTGSEALIGTVVSALEEFSKVADRYVGSVQIHGEFWTATSPAPVHAGEQVSVQGRDGLRLIVHPVSTAAEALVAKEMSHQGRLEP